MAPFARYVAPLIASLIGSAAMPQALAGNGWRSGETFDSKLYAGVDVTGSDGARGLYLICRAPGQAALTVVGLDGGPQPMRLVIDDSSFVLSFRESAQGWPESVMDLREPLIDALQTGTRLQLQTIQGVTQYDLGLTGSARALTALTTGC